MVSLWGAVAPQSFSYFLFFVVEADMSFTIMQIGNNVSFQVTPNAVRPTSYNNVKIISILSYDDARRQADVESLHSAFYAGLPPNSPRKASDYIYYKVRTQDGTDVILGKPWIVESSISLETTRKAIVTIDNVNPDKRQDIINALSAIGFKTVDVELI